MKIDFSQVLNNIRGEPLQDPQTAGEFTLGKACIRALLSNIPTENATGQKKSERYALAELLLGGGEIDVKPEQVVEMKHVVGAIWSPEIVGPAYRMLDLEND